MKMLFEILTDKEIEALKERALRQRNFYAGNLLRWKQRSDPSRWGTSSIAACTLQRRLRHAGRGILDWCERAGCLAPVRQGKRLTLFKRDDLDAAQLRISWGELP